MTIGIFLEHYDPFISGVITSVKNIRRELEKKGHTVYIVCPAVKDFNDKDTHIIRIPSLAIKESDNTTIGLPSPGAIKRLMAIKFDVIHSQDILATAGAAVIIAKKQAVPYIQTYHTLWHRFVEQYKLGPGFKAATVFSLAAGYPTILGMRATANLIKKYSSQERLSYSSLWWSHMVNMGNYADAVTVPSGHLRNSLVDAGVQTKVHHIPNGLTKSTYPGRILPLKKPNVMRIISVGRFSPEKRLDVLISTLAKLRFKAELIMVGDGPDFSAMEQLAAQNGLGRKVRFMGHLDNAAVRQLMKESDVFCLASYDFDNQPMVILEALDAGLPIVYCDHKLSEGLKPQNSLLTGRLPADFATALEKLKNDQLRRKMSTASKQLAPDYDTAKVSARLLGVYQSAGARI